MPKTLPGKAKKESRCIFNIFEMKKLKIHAFKGVELPLLAELSIFGGIACDDVHNVLAIVQVENPSQAEALCNSGINYQCQNSDGSTGTFSGCL